MFVFFSLIRTNNGSFVVKTLTKFRTENRTPKLDAIIFTLALCCRCNDQETKRSAYASLPEICRNPANLFQFLSFCKSVSAGSGWGRAHRRAVANWYLKHADRTSYDDNDPEIEGADSLKRLVYHLFKYQSRYGWSHKDVFRLCHFKESELKERTPVKYLVLFFTSSLNHFRNRGKEVLKDMKDDCKSEFEKLVDGYIKAKSCQSMDELIGLIYEFHIPREVVPSRMLNYKGVWQALLRRMPLTALIRNLGKMSSLGVFEKDSAEENLTIEKLTNSDILMKSKVHPFTILVALNQYRKGRGERGSLKWQVNQDICEALENAFYLSFNVIRTLDEKSSDEKSRKNYLLAMDVNGSMNAPVMGTPAITARDTAAALAMVTVRSGHSCTVVAFSGENGKSKIKDVDILNTDLLPEVLEKFSVIDPGNVDCSLLLQEATEAKVGQSSILRKESYDVFIVYTSFQTEFSEKEAELLQQYNSESRFVLCGLTNSLPQNSVTPKLLEITGFDSYTPSLINEFLAGTFEGLLEN